MLPHLVRVPREREGPGDDQREDDRLQRRFEVEAGEDPLGTSSLSEEQLIDSSREQLIDGVAEHRSLELRPRSAQVGLR